MSWSTTFVLNIAVFLMNICASDSKIFEVKNSWNTGFQGIFNIPITEETKEGWKLEVKFHERLTSFEVNGLKSGSKRIYNLPPSEYSQLWAGKLESAEQGQSGSKYVFVNHPYNKVFQRGEVLEAEFTAMLTDDTGPRVPPVTVKFQHRVVYSDHYDMASDLATVSTTDIAFVINSFTKRPTGATTTTTGTPKPVQSIHEVTVSTTESVPTEEVPRISPKDNADEGDDDGGNEKVTETPKAEVTENVSNEEELGSGVETVTISNEKLYKARRTKYPYSVVIHKSLLFYEAQRSGRLPPDNRVKWRFDSALNDTGENGEDLTGGYYDAGDHVKFTFPMAFSMTTLAWGVIEYWEAYEQAGELENVLKAIKWGIDFIVKSYVGKYELYGQVGNGKADHAYWGRPEDMTMPRPAYKITADKPGSDLAAECSAALSAASLAFERSNLGCHLKFLLEPFANPAYITKLRETAESLYEFARNYKGRYHKSITDAKEFYPSYSYIDELLWARVWLYRATGENEHLQMAEGSYYNQRMFKVPGSMMFSWDDKIVGIQTLLAQVTGGERRNNYLRSANTYCQRIRTQKTRFTRKGLLFMDKWSPLRYAANIAFICQMVADQGADWIANYAFARSQIHYMLGDSGRSYVVGFGKRYPKTPHHRASSCAGPGCGPSARSSQKPNPHILHGALVGGPNSKDIFKDNRADYRTNEVALDHNSCFQGAVAALLKRSLVGVRAVNTRSHEPWYDDFLNYTATARTPVSTTSDASVPKSPLFLFGSIFTIMVLHLTW